MSTNERQVRSGSYVTASGSLLADFHLNVTAEAQGRLQLARLFHMTDDPGVKQMLRFLLARDTAHQKIWLAAIDQLHRDGLEDMPVPEAFPDTPPENAFADVHLGFSARGGAESDGLWPGAYDKEPLPHAEPPVLPAGDPRLYCS